MQGWQHEAERVVAEVLARAVTNPLDVASILQQSSLPNAAVALPPPLGLQAKHNWTGVVLSCARLVAHAAIKGGVLYEAQLQLRTARRRRKATTHRSPWQPAQAGSFVVEWGRWWWLPMLTSAIGSAGAVAFSYPLASLRSRLVAQLLRPEGPVYAGAWDALRRVYSTEGLRGLYRGLLPLVLGAIVFDVVAFGGYQLLTRMWYRPGRHTSKVEEGPSDDNNDHNQDRGGWLSHFCRGCLASMLALVLSHPFELVSRRMVAERVLSAAAVGAGAIDGGGTGMVALARRIASEEGLRAFFVGLWPLLLRVIPYAALTYAFHRLLFHCRLMTRTQVVRSSVELQGQVRKLTEGLCWFPQQPTSERQTKKQ